MMPIDLRPDPPNQWNPQFPEQPPPSTFRLGQRRIEMDKLRLKFDNRRRFCVQTRTTGSGLRLRRGGGSNNVPTVIRRTIRGMVLDVQMVGSDSQFSGIERDISEPIQEIRKRFRIAAKNDG